MTATEPASQAPVVPSAAGGSTARRTLACLVVVAALVALDLWSKATIFAWFEDPARAGDFVRSAHGHPRYPLVGGWLAFMENLNYGAAFGQGHQWPWVLVIGRGVAVLLLAVLVTRVPRGQKVYLTSLVLILSGALGNLYDNLFYTPRFPQADKPFGPVRDFIDVYFSVWDWHFPTFNVADSCITVGAILLLLSGFFTRPPVAEPQAEAAPEADPALRGPALPGKREVSSEAREG
ncbi:MAG: signal peptidase II [Planctomycetota bacterium]